MRGVPYKSPREAIHQTAEDAAMCPILQIRRGGPGGFIKRLPEETRAQLRELRSEDVTDVADWWIKLVCAK